MAHKSAKELAAIRNAQKERHRIKQALPGWIQTIEGWMAAGMTHVRGNGGKYRVTELHEAAKARLEKIKSHAKSAAPTTMAA